MHHDICKGYYTVRIDGPRFRGVPETLSERQALDGYIVPLDRLAEALPHGSGIDGDWYIHVHKNGNLTVTGELHCMNYNGFYDGWERFSFRIYRAPSDVIHPLKGPCAGKVQVIHRKGDVLLGPVRGIKRARYRSYSDYLDETIVYALRDIIPPIRNEIEDASDGREGQTE